jgi:nitrogen fixation NifU-like protein
MYSAEVLDHFEHPRNAGTIADADASVRIENPACGDILELTIKIADGGIEEIRFRAKGCVVCRQHHRTPAIWRWMRSMRCCDNFR